MGFDTKAINLVINPNVYVSFGLHSLDEYFCLHILDVKCLLQYILSIQWM